MTCLNKKPGSKSKSGPDQSTPSLQQQTMADALIQLVVEKLISAVVSDLNLIRGFDKQLKSLAATLSTIAAVLVDADRRQIKDAAVSLWLRRLKLAAYSIEDILDDYSLLSLKNNPNPYQKIDKLHSSFLLPSFDNILLRRSIARRANVSLQTLEKIAEEKSKFQLHSSPMADSPPPPPSRRSSSFLVGEVYGREKDKELVVDTIINVFLRSTAVSVYAVVGAGGLGKTTLVQTVYADERVREHFDSMLWVCLSEHGGRNSVGGGRGMATAVLTATTGRREEGGMEQVQRKIDEEFQGKRYLIVLDDVWEEDEQGWEELRAALPAGDGGSAVIVTTRFARTAAVMATTAAHRLGCLSDEHCWEIFRRRAFAGKAERGGGVVAVGKEIVKKCGGVPMAAMALGSMMRFKEEEGQWISVKESEIWRIEESSCYRNLGILPALRLSYDHLPLMQKRCFSFCGVFPRGHRISKSVLVHLWISNSLISSPNKSEEEDAGEDVFDQLYCSSFFSDEIRGDSGEIVSVKIHDLMYDLAISVAGEEFLKVAGGEVYGSGMSPFVKHVAVVSGEMEAHVAALTAATESVRSLLQLPRGRLVFSEKALRRICCDSPAMRFLRVLDGGGMNTTTVLPCVGDLKHLRYLDLSNGAMKKLPDSISGLFHLQFLILRHCSDLRSLPKEIVGLVNLRCLDIHGCSSLDSLPPGISRLRSLNSISAFIIGREEGRRVIELKELNLRGEIVIKNLENVENPADAISVNLESKKNLRSLEFQWGKQPVDRNSSTKILQHLKPCSGLRNLRIQNYSGDDFPLWMKEFNLGMITNLDLSSCENCSKVPELGHLRSLKTLKIVRMMKIQWINEEIHFPSLEFLSISVLPNLLRLCKHQKPKNPPFPNLKKLSVADCPNLILSPLPALTDLKCYGCSELLLTSIPALQSLTLENMVIAVNATLTKLPSTSFSNLTHLRSLRIESFSKLKSLSDEQLHPLKSLKSLQIRHCDALESSPEIVQIQKNNPEEWHKIAGIQKNDAGKLPEVAGIGEKDGGERQEVAGNREKEGGWGREMESIEVVGCRRLVELPWRTVGMKKLKRVEIRENKSMEVVPERVRGAGPWLKEFTISGCGVLKELPEWVGEMTCLTTLRILFCPMVKRLPPSLKMLNKLQHLYVWGCPELHKRCRECGGEDRDIVAHVPYLHFYAS